jgi:hypothetical protein
MELINWYISPINGLLCGDTLPDHEWLIGIKIKNMIKVSKSKSYKINTNMGVFEVHSRNMDRHFSKVHAAAEKKWIKHYQQ